jgi:uncharacterized protein YecT (DUF1311 family)
MIRVHNLEMGSWICRKHRRRISISVFLLAGLGASAPLLIADETILPHGWSPSVIDEVDHLKSELETEQAQQGINRLTGRISSLLDAELFVTYVRLFDHLDARAQAVLKKEQADWLKQREKVARVAGKREDGGSASSMESNYAFSEFTAKRIQLLNDRLKKLGMEPHE